MFKVFVTLVVLTAATAKIHAQRPKDGTYKFTVAFAEAQGESMGSTCEVKVKGDSVFVINDGSFPGEKGKILDSGILRQHKKTGRWLISTSVDDVNLPEGHIGGCQEGPNVLDFKKKKWWTC